MLKYPLSGIKKSVCFYKLLLKLNIQCKTNNQKIAHMNQIKTQYKNVRCIETMLKSCHSKTYRMHVHLRNFDSLFFNLIQTVYYQLT